MNVKRISLVLVFSAFSSLAMAAPTSTMVQVNQLDPNNGSSISQINGQSANDCATACQSNSQCVATYYVNQQCWLKGAIQNPQQKLFEPGVGGIKATVFQ